MLSEERIDAIRAWGLRKFANGQHGGYHGRVSKMIVDLLEDRAALLAKVERLRDALRAVMEYLDHDAYGCTDPDLETLDDCGKCSYCKAWQATQDALGVIVNGKQDGAT